MRVTLDTPCISIYADKFMDFYEYADDYIDIDEHYTEPLKEQLEYFLKDDKKEELQEGEEERIRDILAKGYAETCNGNYYKIEAVEVYTDNQYTWEYHLIIPVEEVKKHNEKVRLKMEQWKKEHPHTEPEPVNTPASSTASSDDVDSLPF